MHTQDPTLPEDPAGATLETLLSEALVAGAATSEHRVLAALRRMTHAIGVHSRRLAADFAITAPQLVALHCVVRRGPVTSSEISREIHLSKSTLVGILDRLEEKGLAMRRRAVRDRRQVFVEATARGRELVARAPSPLQSALSDALRGMPASEQEAMAAFLERIAALMEAGAE
jgi:DNA-binding MarR family transcriptional regulator